METFRIKALPKDGSAVYYVHNGMTFNKEYAEAECKDCNRYWGDKIQYVLEKVSKKSINKI